jgi:hypothetical protein
MPSILSNDFWTNVLHRVTGTLQVQRVVHQQMEIVQIVVHRLIGTDSGTDTGTITGTAAPASGLDNGGAMDAHTLTLKSRDENVLV